MTWIKVEVEIIASLTSGEKITREHVRRVIDQVKQDALFGTFAEMSENFWRDKMERNPDQLALIQDDDISIDEARNIGQCKFTLLLESGLFSVPLGGAQHLFGILAGDLFQFTLPPVKIENVRIRKLSMPDEWVAEHVKHFRRGANSIEQVRKQFDLSDGMPLIAFSFKPRTGFKLEVLERLAGDVLDAGVNLVELDTRFLARDMAQLDALCEIAKRLSEKKRRTVGRLSINLSLPADILTRYAHKLVQEIEPPVVMKIDGGLDGLSGLQSVRRSLADATLPPIVTCYPLMRSTLAQFIPSATFVAALSHSGADIVYPGGRPDIGKMTRSLGGNVDLDQAGAVSRYVDIVKGGWPMPSIAGGIYAGQLQAFYELLGPNVAWFLGGGIALHPDGPKKGAEICVRIAAESSELRQKAGNQWAENLSANTLNLCEGIYDKMSALPNDELRYVSPKEVIAKVPGISPYWKDGGWR